MAGFSFVPLWPVIGSRLQKMSASSFISFASIPVAIDSLPGMAPAQTAPRSVPALLRRFLAAPILTVLDLAGQTTRSQSTRRQRRRPEDAPAHRPREHHRSQPDRCSETELYEVTCHQVKHTTRGSSRAVNRTARAVLYDNVIICSPCFSAYQTAYQTAYFVFKKPSLQPVPIHRGPNRQTPAGWRLRPCVDARAWGECHTWTVRRFFLLGAEPELVPEIGLNPRRVTFTSVQDIDPLRLAPTEQGESAPDEARTRRGRARGCRHC